jgi:PPP family 3-phenylpropionic acid transporter
MARFSVHYFLLFTAMAMVYPYFQLFLRARGFSRAEVGYLQGVLALAGICGPLLIGHLADRTGRRRAFVALCLVAYALLLLPLNVTSTFWPAAAFVAGIGFAVRTTIPLTDTLAAGELTDPIHQYGRVRVWGSIGFVVTLLGVRALGLVNEQSSASMTAGMLVTAGACVVSALCLRERRAAEHGREVPAGPSAAFDSVFWLFVLATGLQQWGMAAYYSFFTIYLHDALGMQKAAWVWAVGSAAEIPLLFYGGRIIRRFGLTAMLASSMVAASVRLCIVALLPTLWVILPSQLLHALTFGVFHAASIEFLRRKVPAARRGTAMALYMSLALALPAWIGSSLGGVVIERWGYPVLYLSYAVPPLVGVVLLAVSGRSLNVKAQ